MAESEDLDLLIEKENKSLIDKFYYMIIPNKELIEILNAQLGTRYRNIQEYIKDFRDLEMSFEDYSIWFDFGKETLKQLGYSDFKAMRFMNNIDLNFGLQIKDL